MDKTFERMQAALNHPLTPDISREEIVEALGRICSSAGFATNERLRQLLQFIVNETLEGRGERIKAYTIAVEILHRPASFDPQKDSIVRIEATRLRRELEHYYLGPGRHERLVISIPKGAYVASFDRVVPLEGQPATPAAMPVPPPKDAHRRIWIYLLPAAALVLGLAAYWVAMGGSPRSERSLRVPALIVQPLADLTGKDETKRMASGLTESLIDKLTRFKELTVIAADANSPLPPAEKAAYVLSGTFRFDLRGIVVQARLIERSDQAVLWSDEYKVAAEAEKLAEVEDVVANSVAARVAEPYGIVFEAERRAADSTPVKDWSEYVCILNSYAYRAALPPAQHAPVRDCLERTVAALPNLPTAWAMLSMAYLDEARFPFVASKSGNRQDRLGKAYEAARRAVDLDPNNVRGQQALMMTLFFRQDYLAALEVGNKAFRLNPNDLELKGELGFRTALYGNWTEGCRLIKETLDESLRKRPYFETGFAICHFFMDDIAESARLIDDADANENPAYHIWAAIIHTANGEPAEAALHRTWLEQNIAATLAATVAAFPGRVFRPQDQDKVRRGLVAAGFALP